MIDGGDAAGIAASYVASLDTWFAEPDDDAALVTGATSEFNFGWVFYWNSARFLATGDDRFALEGNSPFIVDRRDGSVHAIGTGVPLLTAIRGYADAWDAPG